MMAKQLMAWTYRLLRQCCSNFHWRGERRQWNITSHHHIIINSAVVGD
jgi:hypothetical protein